MFCSSGLRQLVCGLVGEALTLNNKSSAMITAVKRSIFLSLGCLSLVAAVIGVFLPLLPTTPFLLLSAYCFSQSSERLHKWLLSHPYFGAFIRDWQMHGIIRTRVKWLATLSMLLLGSYPVLVMIQVLWVKILVTSGMLGALVFIWSRPSAEQKPS